MRFSVILLKYMNESNIGLDFVKLFVRAGTGGNGIARYNGIGGGGGYIVARPTKQMTFYKFINDFHQNRRELKAENGHHSKQTKLVGRSGKDLIIDVPLGVEIYDKNHNLLAKCTNVKQRYMILSGGRGGCAMNGFKGEKGDRQLVTIKQICVENKEEKNGQCSQ